MKTSIRRAQEALVAAARPREQRHLGASSELSSTDNDVNELAIWASVGGWSDLWVFVFNFLVMIPFANMLGETTESLALHPGGGLVNATFGNAVEVIVAIFALKAG
ncbi:hypothetical protein PR003_g1285 [Phytophthora rubi]|nr:hypothetical protein PR003_g1285 [Phytophthora rubi]